METIANIHPINLESSFTPWASSPPAPLAIAKFRARGAARPRPKIQAFVHSNCLTTSTRSDTQLVNSSRLVRNDRSEGDRYTVLARMQHDTCFKDPRHLLQGALPCFRTSPPLQKEQKGIGGRHSCGTLQGLRASPPRAAAAAAH